MGAFGQASFDGHFKDTTGQNISVDLIFEIPFDCILKRASVFTNSAIAVDAYVTMFRGTGVAIQDQIVNPGQLAAFTNQLNGIDLANLPMFKGDKITVRLNVLSLNTLQKVKWVLGCASPVGPLSAAA
jgi:hypothetical protein